MQREWVFFDQGIIESELDALPAKDASKIASLMTYYRTVGLQNPAPAMVDDYGEGIKRLRHIKPAYQGRVLFFATDQAAAFERLVVLTIYKKEGREVPSYILNRARTRMAEYKRRKGTND